MAFKTLEEFLSLFGEYELTTSGRYKVRCRSHADGEDKTRWSLSIYQDHEKILAKCFAGCTIDQIVSSVGLEKKDLHLENGNNNHRNLQNQPNIETTYDYTDENGNLIFQVVRYKPKNFKQRRPNGKGDWIWSLYEDDPEKPGKKKIAIRLVLFHLPRIVEAISKRKIVFVCEGERDVLNMEAIGVYATCNPMGAGKWHPEYSQMLKNAKVIVIPDNDNPGREHAQKICQSLKNIADTVCLLTLTGEGVKDASDWISSGGTKEELKKLISNLEEWQPLQEHVENTELDEINVTDLKHRRDITEAAIKALTKSNTPPVLFSRSGSIVRVEIDEEDNPLIHSMGVDSLSGRLDRIANFARIKNNFTVYIPPPTDVVKDILSLGRWPFPPLWGISQTPIIKPDGDILDQPGYDTETKNLYIPAPKFKLPLISETPTSSDVDAAKKLLQEIIIDFPWENESSKTNMIGAMITPILHLNINGLTPMFLIDAPQSGTGKTLLAHIIALIATGKDLEAITAPTNEEEWRKIITSMLREGRKLIVIDNVRGKLNSTSLISILTAKKFTDRILGMSEMTKLPHRAIWIGTGNNIQTDIEMMRRCYKSKINAKRARAWQNDKEFKHPDLTKWVLEERANIVAAILILARNWIKAGKPQPRDLPRIGGFENWVNTIGGILQYNGFNNFLSNTDEMYSSQDEETPQWLEFVTTWHKLYEETFYTTQELQDLIKTNTDVVKIIPDGQGKFINDEGFPRKLGKMLMKRAGTCYENDLSIQRGDPKRGSFTWAIKPKDWKPGKNAQIDLNI